MPSNGASLPPAAPSPVETLATTFFAARLISRCFSRNSWRNSAGRRLPRFAMRITLKVSMVDARITAMKEVTIAVRDGIRIGAAIYAPEGSGRFPALLAASPYRYDNNTLPAGPQFLWRETGPIDFYVKHGYAYVHMDVRGSGKSGGQFEFLGPNEQNDLYDVIKWIAQQPWSNGKVGGLG